MSSFGKLLFGWGSWERGLLPEVVVGVGIGSRCALKWAHGRKNGDKLGGLVYYSGL